MSEKYRPKVLALGVPHRVEYKNYRGELSERVIVPITIWYGHTEFHKEDQWLLKALDKGKGQIRDFALVDMKPAYS